MSLVAMTQKDSCVSQPDCRTAETTHPQMGDFPGIPCLEKEAVPATGGFVSRKEVSDNVTNCLTE